MRITYGLIYLFAIYGPKVFAILNVSRQIEKRPENQLDGEMEMAEWKPRRVDDLQGGRGEMVRAVGYIRVSTEEQARHGISLDMQRAKIEAYAALEGMQLLGIVADEGLSGCSIKGRPGVQEVLRLVREKRVDAVVIFKLDRLARNTVEALGIAQLMERKDVGLHSISEKLDTQSAMGKFFFTLMASLAEMERGIISERIRAAMDRKRQRGEACSGNAPYGFYIEGGMLVPDTYEESVIKRIRSLRSEKRTVHQIMDILKGEGLHNREGRPFGKSQLHVIIQRHAA